MTNGVKNYYKEMLFFSKYSNKQMNLISLASLPPKLGPNGLWKFNKQWNNMVHVILIQWKSMDKFEDLA